MTEREKRILQIEDNLREAISLTILDKENSNYLGNSINKFEFMVALNFAITDIYNALGVDGGNLAPLDANYISNKVIVQYLMRYGKIDKGENKN